MTRTEQTLTETVRGVVRTHVGSEIALADDTSLMAAGLVDSMSLVDLILDLEEALGRRLARDTISVDDFESIGAIVRALDRAVDRR